MQINQRTFRASLLNSTNNNMFSGIPVFQLSPQENQVYAAFDIDNMSPEEIIRLQEQIDLISNPSVSSSLSVKFRTVARKDLLNPRFNKKCEICEEDLNEGDDIGQLACSHAYHTICLDSWVKIYSVCPICKK